MESGNFFQTVYDIVRTIPSGKVMTYGQIAALAGKPRAARLVGQAMGRAPSDQRLPCHRVVNQRGSLAPKDIFGGAEIQRLILASEGITFLAGGQIDLKKHLWKNGGQSEETN